MCRKQHIFKGKYIVKAKCDFPGCTEEASTFFQTKPYCKEHYRLLVRPRGHRTYLNKPKGRPIKIKQIIEKEVRKNVRRKTN